MEYRSFGATSIQVSALGMGCSRLGAFWQGRDDRAGLAAIEVALEKGITFFDTADSYGRGRSERLLGRAVRSQRERLTIATKCGLIKMPAALRNAVSAELSPRGGVGSFRSAARAVRAGRTYSATYIRRAAESSLRRLGTAYVDVFMLHSPPVEALVDPELVEAMESLKRRGLIRVWGISAGDEATALRALALPGVGALQVEVNLCHPHAISEVVPRAVEQGVAVIARQPFGSGKLLRPGETHEAKGARPTPSEIIAASLHFPLTAPGVATVIAGMSRPQHVERNVRAAGAVISPSDIERVRTRICDPGG